MVVLNVEADHARKHIADKLCLDTPGGSGGDNGGELHCCCWRRLGSVCVVRAKGESVEFREIGRAHV